MRKEIDYNKLPESDTIINKIVNDYKKGNYNLILAYGPPNSGKSSACIRLGELCAKELKGEFSAVDIVDSLLGLVKRIRNVKKLGEVIVVEEASVLFPSRRAMSADNLTIGKILDTIRKKRIVLFVNAPIFTSIDSHIRTMATIAIECMGVNKTEKIIHLKPFRLQTSPSIGKTYRHRLLRQDGKEVHRAYVRFPSDNIWNVYENKKDEFLEKLYTELEAKSQDKENKLNKQLLKHKKADPNFLSKIEIDVQYYKEDKGMLVEDIMEKTKLKRSTIYKYLKHIEDVKKNQYLQKPNLWNVPLHAPSI